MKVYRLINDSELDFVTADLAELASRIVALTQEQDKFIGVDVDVI